MGKIVGTWVEPTQGWLQSEPTVRKESGFLFELVLLPGTAMEHCRHPAAPCMPYWKSVLVLLGDLGFCLTCLLIVPTSCNELQGLKLANVCLQHMCVPVCSWLILFVSALLSFSFLEEGNRTLHVIWLESVHCLVCQSQK